MSLRSFSFVLLCAAAVKVAAQTPNFTSLILPRQTVDALVHYVPQSDTTRLTQLKRYFGNVQCNGPNIQEQSAGEGTNLICTLPAATPASGTRPAPATDPGSPKDANPAINSGPARNQAPGTEKDEGTVLFIANYAHQGSGASAVENWSGALMLPLLYNAAAAAPRQHTYVFAEVNGQTGADALERRWLTVDRHRLTAVVALDALGLGPVQYYISAVDSFDASITSWLARQLVQASLAARDQTPLTGVPGMWFKTDVTRPFRYRRIPTILLQSVRFDRRHLPGSAEDKAAAIGSDDYFETYHLLCYYVALLDSPAVAGSQIGPQQSAGHRR
jgi:hypothetical protein